MPEFKKPRRKMKKEKEREVMHRIVNVSHDPCKYSPNDKLLMNTLIGIEVELEGVNDLNINHNGFLNYWNVVEDGSLRDGGMEYVLTRPFAGDDLITALDIFDKTISKSGHDIRLSERTSVHIHIDVRDLTYAQLMRFVSLYAVFEESLFKIAGGENRKNGIFATSLANAEGYISRLGSNGDNPENHIGNDNLMHFSKYSACNLAAVKTYGSLEFRNHEGTYDTTRILNWINILLSLRKEAVNNKVTLEGILEDISLSGAEKVFKSVFGKYSESMMYPDLEFDMFNGLRLAQDIIHSANLYKGVEFPKPDNLEDTPFTTFYRKRNKERFKKRISSFIESMGSPELYTTSMDYGAVFDAMRRPRAPERPVRVQVGEEEIEGDREDIELIINRDHDELRIDMV